MMKSRLVVVGVDAGDVRLVRKWAGEGHLPTFAGLLESGLVAAIATPEGVLEGGIWPTFLTSSLPATHGMFAFQSTKPGSYDIENGMFADRLPAPPFWKQLSTAGKRVAVVDAPFARPVEGLNGVQITNWGAHDAWCWPRSSTPTGLIDDIVKRFGDHPIGHCDAENRVAADFEALRAGLIAGARQKAKVLRHVLTMEDWDFYFGVFSEAHCAGHQFWHLMDPGHPKHGSSASPTLRSALLDVYRTIDEGIGSVLSEVGPNVSVLVMLSHGMGPFYAGTHLLDQILDRLGMGERPEAPGSPGIDSYKIRGLRGSLWGLRRLIPLPARRVLQAMMPRSLGALWGFTHPVPSLWKPGMRAYTIPSNNMTGAIRINLKGREPFGTVAPGLEYDKLCEDLIATITELENPDTGRRAVNWVRRARDLYEGPRFDSLPDLFVEWHHDAPINALRSPRLGTVSGAMTADRTGDHWQQGLLLGRGPLFQRGAIGQLRTQDIAPTLLELFGVPIPSRYEGHSVAAEVLSAQAPTV